jgi:hypothetical protein
MLPVKIKRSFQIILMIIFNTVAFLLSGNSIIVAQNNGPRATVKEPVKDAGAISSYKKLVHDFIICNNGNAPLYITDVKAACGCTATDYDKMIAPGKTGRIHAVTDISGFTGMASKDIAVFTNDPANPIIMLTSKARVINELPVVYSGTNKLPGAFSFISAFVSLRP